MAILSIEPNAYRYRGTNHLSVAPDWILGANEHFYFVGSTGTTGTMDIWRYDEYDLKEMIEFLSKKIIGKHEANIFRDILFELHSLLKGGGSMSAVFNKDIEYFTYLIKIFQPDDILTRKINHYLPPTKSHKQKYRILYLLVSLQHLICEKAGCLDLRIPTVHHL